MNEVASWTGIMEKWHDFFLLAGTAAVTLAGLLFVAISQHVETLVKARREHLLELARAMLLSFLMVLVLSLTMLVPQLTQRIVGTQIIVFGSMFSLVTLRLLIVTRGEGHADFTINRFRRRLLIPLFGYLWVAAIGFAVRNGADPDSLNFILGAITVLLINAAGTSWDLLVRVARIRRSDAHEEAAK